MLAKRIIPCLDVTAGRVVKGVNFINLKDAGDAVKLAKRYDREGADELVFLDITASSDKRGILMGLVERVAKEIFIPFTVGGGISDLDTIRSLLLAGADKVSINSAALSNPTLISEASLAFGTQCIVVAIDARRRSNGWEVYTHGGRKPTGIDAIEWAKTVTNLGAGEILLTSMDKDGTKDGYDIELVSAVGQSVSVPVIASGGAGTVEHIVQILPHCEAALLASLLHFGEVTLAQIKSRCQEAGLPIRPLIS